VELLGTLPAHETVTGFSVTPVVGWLRARFAPVPDAGEVAEVFAVPLAHLADPAATGWSGGAGAAWRNYYVVPWGPYYIWGATARILRGLAERMAVMAPDEAICACTGGWLEDPARRRSARCCWMPAAGHQALFVGGCVRNALLGLPVADVDLATDACPTG
jgi:hypothetical protein